MPGSLLRRLLAAVPLALTLSCSLPAFAQSSAALHAPGKTATRSSHDSDRDGALIGGAVGAVGLGLYISIRSDCCASLGLLYGGVIGGLAGLIVGGLVDASDAFESKDSEPTRIDVPPDSLPSGAPPDGVREAAEEDSGSSALRPSPARMGPIRPGLRTRTDVEFRPVPGGAVLPIGPIRLARESTVRPGSRRADLYGAIIGGLLLGYLTNMAYCEFSDTECGLSLKVMAPGMLIGGILGAGIGSAVAGEDEELENDKGEPQENEEELEDRR